MRPEPVLNSFGDLPWQPLLDSRGSVTVVLNLRDLLSRDCQGAVRLPQTVKHPVRNAASDNQAPKYCR